MATESEIRAQFVKTAQKYIGCKESDGSHKKIIDLYNSKKPKGYYTMKYTDAWCATFVSAVSAECGLTDIIPMECSCSRMIKLFEKLGTWHENENYIPKTGDIIFYDWQDGINYAVSDNQGASDHVGIVESVSGNTITVIEGNAKKSVKRLGYKVNGRYLRGFGLPAYSSLAGIIKPMSPTASAMVVPQGKIAASQVAKYADKGLSGTYKVTSKIGLHIRDGAGSSFTSFMVLPYDTEVKNYGYFNPDTNGQKWLYVQGTFAGVTYIGYCSNAYLTKVA